VRILSVNVGQLREVTVKNRHFQTGIYKVPVKGPVPVDRYGLQDDVMIEKRKMGREHSAVYAYPYEHYAYWQSELGRSESFVMGQFGENLTVTGLLEEEVRIGDIFRVDNTILQVAHHRIPCHKLNERMGLRFAPMFLASRKVGFYFRVLEEGTISEGSKIELLERDETSPTMEEFVRVLHFEYWDTEALQRLLQARDLMPAWQESIEAKLIHAYSANGWHGMRELKVMRIEKENSGATSLYLQCAKDKALSPFRGGQQLMVVLNALGSSGNQERGAYYLSSNPQDPSSYRITIQNTANNRVSAYLCDLKPNDIIRCNAPYGVARTIPEEAFEKRVPVLVCQGIGIAPVLSLLYELEAQNAPQVWLFHEPTKHDPPTLLLELKTLLDRNPSFRVIYPDTGRIDAALLNRHTLLNQSNIEIAATREFIARLEIELMTYNISPASMITYKID